MGFQEVNIFSKKRASKNKLLGKPFETSNTAVNKVSWNPHNKESIVTASQDGSIKLWV